ncbi:MAG TPA: lipid A 3-O-deacylase [Porphyromonadaceae bacterium]|jgi:hypothetical protein|nr:lipid A 3-O-deacylase [Porphyromonadaceae bacterium]
MKIGDALWWKKTVFIFMAAWLWGVVGFSQTSTVDSLRHSGRALHRIGMEVRPGYVFPTNPFVKGENAKATPIDHLLSAHVRYAFEFDPVSPVSRIYRNVYQGIGFAYYSFDNRQELGEPLALYFFQGATLGRLGKRLALNYEWNFGISGAWKTYDEETNPYNGMMGSELNAYMNVNFYLKYALSRRIDLVTGFTLTHFSNGNTKFPNAGLNAVDLKAGLAYHFNRDALFPRRHLSSSIPAFPRHVSYDVVLFGSWRRKGVIFNEQPLASPDTYSVFGFNFSPMYNLGYSLRLGASLDGVYDTSANIYTEDYIIADGEMNPGYTFYRPGFDKQWALGLSARAEYVMPYFTVGAGIGANVLHGGGDLKGFYQILALKIKTSRHSFIHIGYNLQNFETPNYLMLGIGYRFHDKSPFFYR